MKKTVAGTVGVALLLLAIGLGLAWFNRVSSNDRVNYPIGVTLSYDVIFKQDVTLEAIRQGELSSSDEMLLRNNAKVSLNWSGQLKLMREEAVGPGSQSLAFTLVVSPETKLDWQILERIEGKVKINSEGEIVAVQYAGEQWIEQSVFVRDLFSAMHLNLTKAGEQIEAHSDFDLRFHLEKSHNPFHRGRYTKFYEALLKRDKAKVEGQVELNLSEKDRSLETLSLHRNLQYQVTTGLLKKESLGLKLSIAKASTELVRVSSQTDLVKDNLKGSAVRSFYEKSSAERVVAGKTFEQVMSSQDDLTGPYDARYAAAEAQVRSWLKLHPEAAPDIAEKAKSFDIEDPKFSSFLAALRDVGSPEAQTALMDITRNSESEPGKRMYFAAYLGDVQHPTEESVNFLLELSDKRDLDVNLAQAAALGLGRIVHVLNDEYDSVRADHLRKHFLDRLSFPKSDDETKDLLAVLGNTRDPKIWSGIHSVYTKSSSEDIKTHVIMAARFLPNPEAHDLLVSESQSTSKARQFAALESLSLSPEGKDDAAVYEKILQSSGDHAVLQQTIKNLGALTPDDPEAKRVMTWFIRNCAQTELCSLAESFAK